jgi:hypothetical protein
VRSADGPANRRGSVTSRRGPFGVLRRPAPGQDRCRAQELDPPSFAAWAKPRAGLIVENLCLRQQLIVLQRRLPRPRLRDGDRRFCFLVC